MLDVIIRGGTIIDGTRAPRFRGDVGITGDRITAIGNLAEQSARLTIDAAGKAVAPGFVDVHNHSDGWLRRIPHLVPKTRQGFTTEVLMADGISYAPVDQHTWRQWFYYLKGLNVLRLDEYQGWQNLAEYMQGIHGRNVQNAMMHVPYANVRALACGFTRERPDDFQMRQIKADIQQGMAEGAVGLSTGLDYIEQCCASTDELVEVCSAMAGTGGLYVTHIRYKQGLMPALREAVEIGRRAGVPVHISHLKGRTAEQVEEVLNWIDKEARHQVDFSFDVYPYQAGSTMLNYLLPYEAFADGPLAVLGKLDDPALRARYARGLEVFRLRLDEMHIAWLPGKENAQHIGKLLSEYVAEMGQPAEEALCNLLIDERLAVLMVLREGNDALVRPFLAHDLYMMGSDGIWHPEGAVHPRVYGSTGRLLGPCVRDLKLFSLEDAVYKLAGFAARRFGLVGRGELKQGNFADVVVFDPATVTDHATYDDPHQHTTGIEHVLVNGVPIIRDSAPVDALEQPLPGRFLKFHRGK